LVVLAMAAAACGSESEASSTTASTAQDGQASTTTQATSDGSQGGDSERPSLVVQMAALGTEALDPTLGQLDDKPWTRLMYSYLFDTDRADRELSDAAGVAESYEWNADQTELTVQLREGVLFHTGAEMTAEDVKFSLERNTDSESLSVNAALVGEQISSIEVLGDYELRITLTAPSLTFIPLLSPVIGGTEGHIYPKAYFEEVGEEGFRQAPVGSGPFSLGGREVGSFMEFVAFDDYFLGEPAVDAIRFEIVPEKSTRIANLQADQADIVEVARDDATTLEGEGFSTFQDEGGDTIGIFPLAWEDALPDNPLSDPRVREALFISTNREEINEFLLQGLGELTASWIGGERALGGQPMDPYPYDPDRAEALLAEAGYEPGELTINLYVSLKAGLPEAEDMALALAADWERVGVTTQVIAQDFGTLIPQLTDRTIEHPAVWFNSLSLRPIWGPVSNLYFNCPLPRYGSCEDDSWAILESLATAASLEEYGETQQAFAEALRDNFQFDTLALVGRVFAANEQVPDWRTGITPFDLNFRYLGLEGLLD
jgi:ABC-type transport system substrate-binding protein